MEAADGAGQRDRCSSGFVYHVSLLFCVCVCALCVQLVDLLLSGDVEVLLDPVLRAAKYAHLSNAKLIRVLDKFKDMSMFSMNTPPQFKKLKKKNVEAVVKKLQKMQQ